MAKLAACRDCGNKISKKTKKCPHCGLKRPTAKRRLGRLVLLLVAVTFLGNGYVNYLANQKEARQLAQMGPDERAKYQAEKAAVQQAKEAAKIAEAKRDRAREFEDKRRWNAFFYAEKAIKQKLKSPSTAEFSSFRDSVAAKLKDGGPNEYVVQGHVDAQNGFGAMIRNQYHVVVEFQEQTDDSIRLVSAELR